MKTSLIPAQFRHENVAVVTDFGVRPDAEGLQTEALQTAFDACKNGGTVVFPRGTCRTAGLLAYSDTTVYLEAGAHIIGSDECEDYAVFPIPAGVELRSDMELIRDYYGTPWETYRRAILSVYGGKNVAVIGEEDTLIDGSDCTDPKGEEGYRGPHGLFLTNIDGVYLYGYTAANCGNFMHEIEKCTDIVMRRVTCLGGSDGTHMHCSSDILIEDCVFRTGDDCIAGINMNRLTVRRCELNTSCDIFRAGGSHFLVEDCRMWGPGIYPHRMTVVQNRGTDAVKDKANTLPLHMGRHNLYGVFLHFATPYYPAEEPYRDVVIRNCTIENAEYFLCSRYGSEDVLEKGEPLSEITLENVTFTGLKETSRIMTTPDAPLTVRLKNVSVGFRPGATDTALVTPDAYTKLIVE